MLQNMSEGGAFSNVTALYMYLTDYVVLWMHLSNISMVRS